MCVGGGEGGRGCMQLMRINRFDTVMLSVDMSC